ncbi:hypothetical protein MLD38_030538 [Melastoma candidum]|uniref:Uncharacterized protein n=1 Tax=Melastoma candidum TaxID=119954 RepID=A0ACB9MNV6_9MYRT|nr:hypothetical protein MLD38_030538 [Melastoma candidum]
MICYPVAGDQFINCKYITEVWKVGVQIKGFRQEEFEEGLAKVTEDEGIGSRLEELHDRVTGKVAITRVEDNLNDFVGGMQRWIGSTRKII